MASHQTKGGKAQVWLAQNDRWGVDNADQVGYKGQVSSASVDDLADAILVWLDDNAPRFDGSVRRTWRTRRLEDAFRHDLQTILLASFEAGARERLILRLIELLQGPATVKDLMRVDWGVIHSEDAASSIFPQIQQRLSTALTGPDLVPGQPMRLSSQEAAEKIIEALRSALSVELVEIPEGDDSLIDVLRKPARAATTALYFRDFWVRVSGF